eukprot:bmy_09044T0
MKGSYLLPDGSSPALPLTPVSLPCSSLAHRPPDSAERSRVFLDIQSLHRDPDHILCQSCLSLGLCLTPSMWHLVVLLGRASFCFMVLMNSVTLGKGLGFSGLCSMRGWVQCFRDPGVVWLTCRSPIPLITRGWCILRSERIRSADLMVEPAH